MGSGASQAQFHLLHHPLAALDPPLLGEGYETGRSPEVGRSNDSRSHCERAAFTGALEKRYT